MKVDEAIGILQSIALDVAEELKLAVEVKSSIITQPNSSAPDEFKGSLREANSPFFGTLCRFRAGVNQNGEIMLLEFTAIRSVLVGVDLKVVLSRHLGNKFSLKHRLL